MKEDTRLVNKYLQFAYRPASSVTGQMHIKTAVRYHFGLPEGLEGRLRTTALTGVWDSWTRVLPRGFTLAHSLWRTGWCHHHTGPRSPRPLHVDVP